jgi:hypothetical protein
MFDSFFKNNRYNDANLKQGIFFNNYDKEVTILTNERLPYLQITSMPGLYSINEALNGDDSILAFNKHTTTELSDNEKEFNKTLSEYSMLQKTLESNKLYDNAMARPGPEARPDARPGPDARPVVGQEASINYKIMKKMRELNNKLIFYSKRISNDMSQLVVNDDTLKDNINKERRKLNKYIQKLKDQESHIIKDTDTVDGMGENTKLILVSNKYYYLMWFILLITFLSLFMYILTSDLVMNTVVVIICLLVIYILAKAISDKYI